MGKVIEDDGLSVEEIIGKYTKAELVAMCFEAYKRVKAAESKSAVQTLEARAEQIELFGRAFQQDAATLRLAAAILEQFWVG